MTASSLTLLVITFACLRWSCCRADLRQLRLVDGRGIDGKRRPSMGKAVLVAKERRRKQRDQTSNDNLEDEGKSVFELSAPVAIEEEASLADSSREEDNDRAMALANLLEMTLQDNAAAIQFDSDKLQSYKPLAFEDEELKKMFLVDDDSPTTHEEDSPLLGKLGVEVRETPNSRESPIEEPTAFNASAASHFLVYFDEATNSTRAIDLSTLDLDGLDEDDEVKAEEAWGRVRTPKPRRVSGSGGVAAAAMMANQRRRHQAANKAAREQLFPWLRKKGGGARGGSRHAQSGSDAETAPVERQAGVAIAEMPNQERGATVNTTDLGGVRIDTRAGKLLEPLETLMLTPFWWMQRIADLSDPSFWSQKARLEEAISEVAGQVGDHPCCSRCGSTTADVDCLRACRRTCDVSDGLPIASDVFDDETSTVHHVSVDTGSLPCCAECRDQQCLDSCDIHCRPPLPVVGPAPGVECVAAGQEAYSIICTALCNSLSVPSNQRLPRRSIYEPSQVVCRRGCAAAGATLCAVKACSDFGCAGRSAECAPAAATVCGAGAELDET